jgi:hypothetical protein
MEKLLAIVGIAQTVYGKWLLQKLVNGVITLIALLLITAVLISAIVVSGCYAIYLLLIQHGYEPITASIIVCGLISVTAIVVIVVIFVLLGHLRRMPHTLLRQKIPIVAQAQNIVDAFLDGLLNRPIKK